MAMKITPEGLDLIMLFEGLMTEAYVDPVGIWTIGYGHIEGVKPGDKITEREAEELLLSDLPRYERGVENLVTVPVNENEFSALVSFVYNVGVGALKSSTALRRLNSGDRLGAADALEWWNKGRVGGKLYILPGLARRRAAEKALFLRPVTSPPATSLGESGRTPPTTKETPNRRDNLAGSRTVQGGAVATAAGVAGAVGAASQSVTKEGEEGAAAAPPVSVPVQPEAPPPTEPTPPPTTVTLAPAKEDIVHTIGNLFDEHPEVYAIVFGLIVLAAIYVLWARIDDWRKGLR